MAKGNRRLPPETITFEQACETLEGALASSLRRDFIEASLKGRDFAAALKRLRSAMGNHLFKTPSVRLHVRDIVRAFDERARQDGFHVLKEWDQGSNSFSEEDVPLLMLDYFSRSSAPSQRQPRALAVLLDYYFLYVLAVLVMRVWDEGDPNGKLDRITALLRELQGPNGSGQRFVEDAATLLFVATSNFQPDERAYYHLLGKVRTLDESHRMDVALIGGPVLGSHLRWALTAIYERDLVRMRDDNTVDYPWLCFSVTTLMNGYARIREAGTEGADRIRAADALLSALSADPWAFGAKPPLSLAEREAELARFRELLDLHRDALLEDFDTLTPRDDAFSPISVQFNFPHNAMVAIVVLSLLATVPLPNLPLNALLARPAPDRWTGEEADLLARGVTGYAAAHPERRGDRRVLIVAYNLPLGIRSFSWTMSALRKDEDGSQEVSDGYVGRSDQSSAMPVP